MLGIILYIKFLDNKKLIKLLLSLLCSFYFGFKLNLILDFKKCSEFHCIDTDFCQLFQNQNIHLNFFSCILAILNPKLTKSVFHGILNKTEWIVIKRKSGRIKSDDIITSDLKIQSIWNDVQLNPENVQNVILCPGFPNLDFLFNYLTNNSYKDGFWFDLKVSIEPLLLMYFNSKKNWPVPEYYGNCDEMIFQSYKGEPLNNFLSAEFKTRAFLSISLLKIAHIFTFEDPKFIFYFTDFSLYNFVIDSSGNVTLVDLDNVIIFNKTATKENISIKMNIHTSQVLDEINYAFSSSDICSHYLSDHNYFSVCKYLLTHPQYGLLREIPEDIIISYPQLPYLLNECSQPEIISDRFSAGNKLQIQLEKILKDYKWDYPI